MFKLDNAFLEELGLGVLPPAEKNKMLAHIYETLEMRVGVKLAEQMSSEQLDEFESYINAQDEAGALKWLETNFPDYKQVVAQQLEVLKEEIRQVAPQIAAQAAAAGTSPSSVAPTTSTPSPQPQPQSAPPTQPAQQQAVNQPPAQVTPAAAPSPAPNTVQPQPSQPPATPVSGQPQQPDPQPPLNDNNSGAYGAQQYAPQQPHIEPYQPPSSN